jgi:hypothetical protein
LKLALASLLAAIRGPLRWLVLRQKLKRIYRHITEPPRNRTKQADRLKTALT